MSEFRRRMMMVGGSGSIGYYTIDQTGTYSDPAQMVRDRDVSGIQAIRSASHLYVGELVNGVLQCKQVSDTDKTVYVDGTSVVYTDNNDLFMKLPRFWWKCENIDNNADIVKISFSLKDKSSQDWHEWAGNIFIGAYLAHLANSKIYSRSGVRVATKTSYNTFKSAANNRGYGYRLMTYEAAQILALLAFGYYATVDTKNTIFNGPQQGTTGICDTLGMTDTNSVTGYDLQCNNFWGLEQNFTTYELCDNLISVSNGIAKVVDINGNEIRRITGIAQNSTDRRITKITLGDYADITPKALSATPSVFEYYCTKGTMYPYKSNETVARIRTLNSIGILLGGGNGNSTWGTTATRLVYEGNYNII